MKLGLQLSPRKPKWFFSGESESVRSHTPEGRCSTLLLSFLFNLLIYLWPENTSIASDASDKLTNVSDLLEATSQQQPGESGLTDEFLLQAPSGGHYEAAQVINQRLALLA